MPPSFYLIFKIDILTKKKEEIGHNLQDLNFAEIFL